MSNLTVVNDGSTIGYAHIVNTSLPSYSIHWHRDGSAVVVGDYNSAVLGAAAGQQVGQIYVGYIGGGPAFQAAIWNDTLQETANLHPTKLHFRSSWAYGTNAQQQVGAGDFIDAGPRHALLWNGTADSAVDLHPAGIPSLTSSQATTTDGAQQVGSACGPGIASHAFLWSGTSNSAIDLHPTQLTYITDSIANGVAGGQQVGSGSVLAPPPYVGHVQHALLWTGTAASAIDLNPAGAIGSAAIATNGIMQVGYFDDDIGKRAVAWLGASGSAVDLNAVLPFDTYNSVAMSIDAAGNIYGTALDKNFQLHVIEWAVPEPSTLTLLMLGCLQLASRRPLRARHGNLIKRQSTANDDDLRNL